MPNLPLECNYFPYFVKWQLLLVFVVGNKENIRMGEGGFVILTFHGMSNALPVL